MHGAPGIPCPRRSPTAQLSTLRTHSPSQAPVPTPVAPVGREGGLPRLSGRWMTAGRHAPLLLLGSGSCVQSCHLPPSNKVTSCSPPHPCQAASPLHPSILLCGFPSPFLPTEVLTHPNLQIPLLPLMWETLGGSSRGRGAADSRAGDRCLLGVSRRPSSSRVAVHRALLGGIQGWVTGVLGSPHPAPASDLHRARLSQVLLQELDVV